MPTYQAFASTELLDQLALERMLAKLSTRRYPAGLEPVGSGVRPQARGDLEVGGLAPVRRPRPSTPWPSCSPRT